MTSTPALSDTQSLILSGASQHEAGLARTPPNLPAAARNAVVRSLLKAGLLEEIAAPAELRDLAWRREEDGTAVALRITADGLRAIGVKTDGRGAGNSAPSWSRRGWIGSPVGRTRCRACWRKGCRSGRRTCPGRTT